MSELIQIKNNNLTVSISTLGAELFSIKNENGTEFLWEGDKKFWGGKAPVLFPICGALKDDKFTHNGKTYFLNKHGFARKSEFAGKKLSDSQACFTLESNEDTLSVYPFDFTFKITYALIENNIRVTYTVENTSEEEMYFSVGAHEAYCCPEGIDEYYIAFDEPQEFESWTVAGTLMDNKTVKVAEKSDKLSLYEKLFENDALVFKNVPYNKASLIHKAGKRKITVSFPGFKNLLLWTVPGARYICLEPWAGFPDSISSSGILSKKEDIIRLDAGREFSLVHTITFEG